MEPDDALPGMRLPWTAQDDLPPLDPGVARLMAAASVSPDPDELVGEKAAVAAFCAAGRAPTPRSAPVNVRRLTRRLAAVSFASALGFGGIAAAYAGALPKTPQRLAHDTLGALGVPDHADDHAKANAAARQARKAAKAAAASASASADPAKAQGPDATGAAKAGLCNAWAASGKPKNEDSTAFRNLALAAGGAAQVETFCADVAKDHPTGKPTARPSHPAKPSNSPKPERTTEPGSQRPSHAGRPSDAGRPSR